jgi:xanthine dehydrogenase accessory factor
MNKQLLVWNFIADSLKQNVPVMLLYVLESKGSSPGRQGFFMAVNANGEMEGSIGGGIMEHKFVEMAKERLRVRSSESGVRKQFHDKSATKDQSGMICSGEQTILLLPVQSKYADLIRQIISSLEKNKNGTLTLLPAGISFDVNIPAEDFEFIFKSEDDWLYKEKTGYKNQLTIIGGGHCGLAFSKLIRDMDFYIRIYDDRENLKTMQANEWAHEKQLVSNYSELKEMISPGNSHYVVIMTFGYRTDDIALRALLGKEFKYLGLLGSKSKIEKMFDDYRKEGIDSTFLEKIHTPIGIAIKSQTPEEIAISIAAEIISIKNNNSGRV